MTDTKTAELVRYGINWKGPDHAVSEPMEDGQAVCVGMAKDWNEASDMLVNIHMVAKKALTANPDTGTTPKQENG